MKNISLDGNWMLRYCHAGEGQAKNWHINSGEGEFVNAHVPGDVHLDLAGAGVIDEPLFGRNSAGLTWMEQYDWWYSREIDIPDDFGGDRVELYFAGLDTDAEIWLNGQSVGAHANMFVPYACDVTGVLHPGHNFLAVRIDCGLRAAQDKELEKYWGIASVFPKYPRMWIRKAQFTFGWDHVQHLLTCGIWRPVELRSYQTAALRDVCLRTHLRGEGRADFEVLVEVENLGQGTQPVMLEVALRDSTGLEQRKKWPVVLQPGVQQLKSELTIDQARLWWPAPLGEPELYDCQVKLMVDDAALDERRLKYGLREIRLVREPLPLAADSHAEGESFRFEVNGKMVFCKGADWIPADHIMARVSKAKYRQLIRLAAEANFNMLRIWGGGIFEDPYFYELCDEYGILVWQDFTYSCSYYPDDDPAFMREARREAEIAVKLLRNYACLALWSGNNENQWLHDGLVAGGGKAAPRCYGERIYNEVLPEVCARLDPTRPYWPSSPWGGTDLNSQYIGDTHAWYANIGSSDKSDRSGYHRWLDDHSKFVTEFGVLSSPPLESLREFLPPDEHAIDSPGWMYHENQFDAGNTSQALAIYWRPAEELDLVEYVRFSQVIQAEALKMALEGWRRRKPWTMGALFWVYTDSWGGVGWTIVDYYLRRKPSYYAVRRAFAHVTTSIDVWTSKDCISVWLLNDTLTDVPVQIRYGLVNVRTGELREFYLETVASANESKCAARIDLSNQSLTDPDAWAAYARISSQTGQFGHSLQFLTGLYFNRVNMNPAEISWKVKDRLLTVKAASFAWQVEIRAPRSVWVEDNFFDLMPGEQRTLQLQGPEELFGQISVSALNA